MAATEIIRWLLSTGRTYSTVAKLQAALVEQVVEYAPIDRLKATLLELEHESQDVSTSNDT